MAVYFITGKLGTGKSLASIRVIKDALKKGVPVATNIDLDLKHLMGRNNKSSRVMRVPDKPTINDLLAIGNANETYNEDRNGVLVLDELGTWLNSRNWADKSRKPVLDWFLHARKLGWDLYMLVQNISIIDAQCRDTLAEHVVDCKRMDRMKIPFVTFLFGLLGINVRYPRIHVASVKLMSCDMKVDTWWYRGAEFYDAYDTKQVFNDKEAYVHSVLPPYTVYGQYNKLTLKQRLTNIGEFFREAWLPLTVCLVLVYFLFNHYAGELETNTFLVDPLVEFVDFPDLDALQGNALDELFIDVTAPLSSPLLIVGSIGSDHLVEYTDGGQYWLSDLISDFHDVVIYNDCKLEIAGQIVECGGYDY